MGCLGVSSGNKTDPSYPFADDCVCYREIRIKGICTLNFQKDIGRLGI